MTPASARKRKKVELPKKGRALQIVEPGKFEIVEIDVPQPREDEVLIEVLACSTCTNWELSMWQGRDIFARPGFPKYPLNPGAPGHEAAGRVVAVGAEVKEIQVGQLVAVKPSLRGPENDAHATHIVRPEAEVAPVADHVPPEEAAPLEMAMCALRSVELAFQQYQGLRSTDPQAGEQADEAQPAAVVVGLGPAGQLHLQTARLAGLEPVVGIEPVAERREVARQFADAVFAPDDPALVEYLGRVGERLVFECSGAAPAMATAVSLAVGTVHIFGVPDGRWTYGQKAWISGAALLPYHWRGRRQAPLLRQAANLLSEGKLQTRPLISTVLPYERYDEGLALLKRRRALKVIFRWE
ncbi:MAG: alcohol dehydrogenase catalytic domain-containing protein [Armatimonadetes bacterium]|nr:alcohol dehydrogenase catalytic domain-containing protein [Armatimonadota bacterium]